jgi:histone H3/H4
MAGGMGDEPSTWRHCSMCKKPIAFGASYFACSVSTCPRQRDPLYFCSLSCWEAHLPMMRHRDAWAEQERAPTRAQWEASRAEAEASGTPTIPDALGGAPASLRSGGSEAPNGRRRERGEAPPPLASAPVVRRPLDEPLRRGAPREVTMEERSEEELPREVLVVVSKLKAYVKARSGMNTSDGVVGVLSDHLRRLCVEAIRNAARDGRRTVMDRDFKPLL